MGIRCLSGPPGDPITTSHSLDAIHDTDMWIYRPVVNGRGWKVNTAGFEQWYPGRDCETIWTGSLQKKNTTTQQQQKNERYARTYAYTHTHTRNGVTAPASSLHHFLSLFNRFLRFCFTEEGCTSFHSDSFGFGVLQCKMIPICALKIFSRKIAIYVAMAVWLFDWEGVTHKMTTPKKMS